MWTASVAELKARLSEFLAVVRAGDDVIVTDRGRPVARLTGLGADAAGGRLAQLVRTGIVKPPARSPSPRGTPEVADDEGRMLRALLQEREDGR